MKSLLQFLNDSTRKDVPTQTPETRHREIEYLARQNFIPITETREKDIFVAGYPKSGNTWVQYLLAGVIYGIDTRQASDLLVQDLFPDVHGNQLYKRYRDPMFFKTHDLPKPQHRRVIHLLRDGRDVMVSYLHFLKVITGNPSLDFGKVVREGTMFFPCKWNEHARQWFANPYDAEMIQIKYEELKSNPLNELRKLCDFAEINRDDEFLQQVIGNTDFKSMRQREIDLGWAAPWPKEMPFVRRGVVGSYQDEMPAEILEYFKNEAGDMLRHCGYI